MDAELKNRRPFAFIADIWGRQKTASGRPRLETVFLQIWLSYVFQFLDLLCVRVTTYTLSVSACEPCPHSALCFFSSPSSPRGPLIRVFFVSLMHLPLFLQTLLSILVTSITLYSTPLPTWKGNFLLQRPPPLWIPWGQLCVPLLYPIKVQHKRWNTVSKYCSVNDWRGYTVKARHYEVRSLYICKAFFIVLAHQCTV